MKISVNPRNAMRIYLAVFLMMLLGVCFGAVTLYRHFSEPESTQVAPRGEISVVVQEANPTPPTSAPTVAPSTPAVTMPDENQGFGDMVLEFISTVWAWVRRITLLLLILSIIGLTIEYGLHRLFFKTDPMPKFKEYKFKPWNVPGWIWCRRWWKKEDKKEEPSSDDKKKKKSDDGVFGKWPAIIGAIIKYSLRLALAALIIGILINPRSMLALVQQLNKSITGTTIPAITRLLAETAPDENRTQEGLPPEQQNPRAISWITTENLPSKAGIVTTAPRSFRTDYIMSDETAFLLYMKDTTTGGEIIIKLRHNRSGELFGWWERIGGPPIKMAISKPSWSATKMPDGSYSLRLQDSEIPTLFEELRIVRQ